MDDMMITKEMRAEFQRQLHDAQSELTRRGMRRKAEAGGHIGPAPIGYVNRRQGDYTWLEIDPVNGPLVREAFELAASGRYSLRTLSTEMLRKGLVSVRGNPIGPSALAAMMRNQIYAGYSKAGQRSNSAAIVSEAVMAAARRELAARRRNWL